MSFCTNCGRQLEDGAKFCSKCGTAVASTQSTSNFVGPQNTSSNTERRTIYDGEIYKCPNCGEALKAFETVCPTCKFELRGAKGSSAVSELTDRLLQTRTEQQKIDLIMNFPIPNTREGVLEFTVLACSNFDETAFQANINVQDISDAWLAKIKQCKAKAQLILSDSEEFKKIQKLCDETIEKAENIKRKAKPNYQQYQNQNIYNNSTTITRTAYVGSQNTVVSTKNSPPKNKWVAFALCLFLGFFGAHKFYEGKIGMGILYIFTVGLFYIGWFVDLVKILQQPTEYYP